jgi:hypothetical protein
VSPRAFTLSANCSTSIFSWLSSASRAAKCKAVISIESQIGLGSSSRAVPSMVASSCLRWSSYSSSSMPAFLETLLARAGPPQVPPLSGERQVPHRARGSSGPTPRSRPAEVDWPAREMGSIEQA